MAKQATKAELESKSWGPVKCGLVATREGRVRAWEGTASLSHTPEFLVVVQDHDFGPGVSRALEFSRASRYNVGIGSEVTGHPNLVGLPNEPGIWQVDDEFRPLRRMDTDGGLLVPEEPEDTGPKLCMCGCGEEVTRRFLPGHDSKLKSRLIRAAKSDGVLDPPYNGEVDPWMVAASFKWLSKLPPKV